MSDPTPVDVDAAKRELRREMRAVRLRVASEQRSRRICDALIDLVEPMRPGLVMVYAAVPGEPDLTTFVEWCRAVGVATVAPEATPAAGVPVDPSTVDVVVVPGLAFTAEGHRLGQGGGWYDRFLADVRDDCLVVGVAFDEQVVEALPVGPNDVNLDVLATDRRTLSPKG